MLHEVSFIDCMSFLSPDKSQFVMERKICSITFIRNPVQRFILRKMRQKLAVPLTAVRIISNAFSSHFQIEFINALIQMKRIKSNKSIINGFR